MKAYKFIFNGRFEINQLLSRLKSLTKLQKKTIILFKLAYIDKYFKSCTSIKQIK